MWDKTYLCGGINGLSDADCKDWRETASVELETKTINPMRRDYRGKEDIAIREIVFRDLLDIAGSRFVLVNATRPSWGTAMEIVYAFLLFKYIVAFTGGPLVSPWLRFHCTAVVMTLEDACVVINGKVSA